MHLDVWIAAPAADAHASCVAGHLRVTGATFEYIPLAEVPAWGMTWNGGAAASLTRNGTELTVDSSTAVWWRRPDAGAPAVTDPDEQSLAADEIRALVPGVLDAAGVRWVDAPWTLLRARQKAVQLAAASACGARTPDFAVTGDPAEGRRLAARTPIVAKAVSTGVGLAPYVAEVPLDALDRLAACPTMLQERVAATADLRVVTVGAKTFGWSRDRAAHTLDWRRDDPAGSDFTPLGTDPTGGLAAAVAGLLDLEFSVQDWLEGLDGNVTFLEVNPQGQWLFLDGADETAAPALAALLAGRP